MRLSRLSFAGVTGEGLRPGAWRYLTFDELTALKKEHGVPKRVVSPPFLGTGNAPRQRPVRPHSPHKKDERPHKKDEGARNPRYGGGSPARRDLGVREDWGGGVHRGSSGPRDAGASTAPPRRGNESTPLPRGDVGGRGGRTRTTGTGGGIGAGEGSYRVRGRRG
jgi:23S rRNA pseudouridine2605 synthase